MAETFFGVSMIPMNYKDEVRQIKSELLCFLRHPREGCSLYIDSTRNLPKQFYNVVK